MDKKVITDENEDLHYKIILLGDTAVGKTCLFRKISTGKFYEKTINTVGIDKKTVDINCELGEETRNVIINLIDTAGQERFRALTKSYYKGSDAAIILYDITEKETFDHVKEWMDSAKSEVNNNNYIIFLMGAKIDLVENGKKERQVTIEEAKDICKECKCIWGGECSNKEFTKDKYIEIFKGFIKVIYDKHGYKRKISQSAVQLAKMEIKPKKRRNCACVQAA